ncbi:adenylate kinase [Pelomyxa schiedti]|nr:adenylate kinase [Pelomyxa schiedti]
MTHVSSGDLLREHIWNNSSIGIQVQEYLAAGLLVPDSIVTQVVTERLRTVENGWLLDGFPRNPGQATSLVQQIGRQPDAIVILDITDDAVVERISQRRIDPVTNQIYHLIYNPPPPEVMSRVIQRPDDTEPVVRSRLALYRSSLSPILSALVGENNTPINVDASQPIGSVCSQVITSLSHLFPNKQTK